MKAQFVTMTLAVFLVSCSAKTELFRPNHIGVATTVSIGGYTAEVFRHNGIVRSVELTRTDAQEGPFRARLFDYTERVPGWDYVDVQESPASKLEDVSMYPLLKEHPRTPSKETTERLVALADSALGR